MGKSKTTLRVYDPYFCDGGVTRRLRRHGFTHVYNRREDFYKVIATGRVPPHDVVLTNPPYSADHMEKILDFVCSSVSQGLPRRAAIFVSGVWTRRDVWWLGGVV
jgi:hypothetical protein